MDFLTNIANWISIVGTASLICAILFKWAMGQFDTKKMLECVGIVLVFCGGITLSSIITTRAFDVLRSQNNICQDIFPYTCAGWPMFTPLLADVLNIIMNKIGTVSTIPSIMVGTLTSIFIWQKLVRGVWLGPLEIASAFLAGVVFFISISYFNYLKDGAFDVINSALSPFGNPDSGLNEFVKNWDSLNIYINKVAWQKMNQSMFSSVFIDLPSTIMGFFQQSITKFGIGFLGLINALFLLIQQGYMILIPIGIIKSIFLFETNWRVGLKGIFSYTFFCVALHIEGLLLSTFVSISQLTGVTENIASQTSAIFYTALLIAFTAIIMSIILLFFLKKAIVF